ncbi:MAG: hypothetical protein AAGK22_18665 [Acidobacteriota bacterium]
MEPRIKKLLEELSELLRDVISDSPEAVEKVDAIQDEGYSLHLLLDCQPSSDSEAEAEDDDAEGVEVVDSESPVSESRPDAVPAAFRINAADLRFLRSVGIDPTRRANKRRYRPEPR